MGYTSLEKKLEGELDLAIIVLSGSDRSEVRCAKSRIGIAESGRVEQIEKL